MKVPTTPATGPILRRQVPADGLTRDLSERSLEQGRNFLSAMFMAVRTAQIHDPGNKAFIHAVDMVHRATDGLFASTGGFSVQFVEDVAFLNGVRLRFETSAFAAVRTLRRIFEQHDLGGITMRTPPSRTAIHRLILLFATSREGQQQITKEDLSEVDIGLLGVQQFADGAGNVQVDRRVFAVQCYGKLVLAVREQVERLRAAARTSSPESRKPPRLRAVRVIQDLVELCGERPDFLLRLSSNRRGASAVELAGANACTLSIACGYALGFDRQSLVDLGVAALFHHLDTGLGRPLPVDATGAPTAIANLLAEGGMGMSSYTRAFVVAERPTLDAAPTRAEGATDGRAAEPSSGSSPAERGGERGGSPSRPGPRATGPEAHPFSRLLGVVAAYDQLTSGFGRIEPVHPLDALALLHGHERFDRRLVDLLMNLLRAFPTGVEVILDNGQRARVHTQAGGSRWDRPVVSLPEENDRHLDLMVRRDSRFLHRIVGTRVFVEAGAPRDEPLPLKLRPTAAETAPSERERLDSGFDEGAFDGDVRSTIEDLDLELPDDDLFEEDPFDEAFREG
ncbi:MAG: hypothetical protein AAFZ18_37840 [Myxococcota bacterium]